MAIHETPQGLPYPDNQERIAGVPGFIQALAEELDKKIVGVYANQNALQAAGPFQAGYMAYVVNANVLQIYSGSRWVRVSPPTPMIHSGTAPPTTTLGEVGDLYVRY